MNDLHHIDVFDRLESQVRYYCRRLPQLLASARGSIITDAQGKQYVDFLSACGALNYGHAHPHLKAAAIDFLASDGLTVGLDFHTPAKLDFISRFEASILKPRGFDHRLQFPSPSGANCVEAAIKLARKVTGRTNVVAFTNAFHGVSLGALGLTGSRSARKASSSQLNGVVRLPYDGYSGASIDELERFAAMAEDQSGGVEPVAAFIIELVQGEGGLNVASIPWLRCLANVSQRLGSLLIVDDIQAGCGRTGSFFSFDQSGIVPDLVCLAKSISGYGFPMSLLLLRPHLDAWEAGEHNGTFRGNSIAFATAAATFDLWTDEFVDGLKVRSTILSEWCVRMEDRFAGRIRAKGIGMMQGLEFSDHSMASRIASAACERGILMECCGPVDQVLKIMAPLNIDLDLFMKALASLRSLVVANMTGLSGSDSERGHEHRSLPILERDEASLDPGDYGGHAVGGSQLTHGVG